MTADFNRSGDLAGPVPTTLRLLLSAMYGFFRSLLDALIHACLRISMPPTVQFIDSPAFGIFGQLNDAGTAFRRSISRRGSSISRPNASGIPRIVHDEHGGDGWSQVVSQRRISKMFVDQYATGMASQTAEARRQSLPVPSLSPSSSRPSSRASSVGSRDHSLSVQETNGREARANSLLVPEAAAQPGTRKRALGEGAGPTGLLAPNTPAVPSEHGSDSDADSDADSVRWAPEGMAQLAQYSLESGPGSSQDL
ncbi:hypothetical protein EC988_006736, partial [Linderina pennispora]